MKPCFVEKSKEIHGNLYDYSKVIYKNSHTPVEIICKEHGSFFKRPVKHTSSKEGCPVCSKNKVIRSRTKFKGFEQIKEFCSSIHNNYRYIKVEQENPCLITTDDILVIECKEHGIFKQTINKHIYQKTGCPKCGVEKSSISRTKRTKDFILKAQQIHGNLYDYSCSVYENSHKKVKINCKEHGGFFMTPANHLHHNQGCPVCNQSGPENIIQQWLIEHNFRFVYQFKFDSCISENGVPLRFDFFLIDDNIAIEYDGIYHYQPIEHGMGLEEAKLRLLTQQRNDKIKDQFAKEKGIRMIRIPFFSTPKLRDILTEELIKEYQQ